MYGQCREEKLYLASVIAGDGARYAAHAMFRLVEIAHEQPAPRAGLGSMNPTLLVVGHIFWAVRRSAAFLRLKKSDVWV